MQTEHFGKLRSVTLMRKSLSGHLKQVRLLLRLYVCMCVRSRVSYKGIRRFAPTHVPAFQTPDDPEHVSD